MAPVREAVVIATARRAFDNPRPTSDALNDRANAILNQLTWWARILKSAREAS